jgi:phosphoglycolate phosphatase
MVKLIVYDLDGTLINSAKIVKDILNQMRAEIGLQHLTIKRLVPWLSMGGEDLVANALEIPAEHIQSQLLKFRKRYAELITPEDSLYPGVKEVLSELSDQGYQLAICTNKPRGLAEKALKETQLHSFFAYLNAGDDLLHKKPHPENILSCLSYFGLSPQEAILVGDSKVDQALAMAAKVAFVQYLPGYDDGIELSNPQMKIDHHGELKNVISGLKKKGNY